LDCVELPIECVLRKRKSAAAPKSAPAAKGNDELPASMNVQGESARTLRDQKAT
jgi:hypothetical protein